MSYGPGPEPKLFDEQRQNACPHTVIRKPKRGDGIHYVCGNCAAEFEARLIPPPINRKDEPMFDRRPPWGFRSRQA
jgi:hypothetical protein